MKRCINIDWLEVYALEPITQPCTPDFFRSCGLWVQEREYGTRLYHQMFTILDEHGDALIEMRRQPKQDYNQGGVLPINACHIRLPNRVCYSSQAVHIMQSFLDTYHIQFQRIFRIDLCLDLERFDTGDDPGTFLFRYIKGKYSKINQSELAPRGKDRWDGRTWNYCHWGSNKSPITTKIYNKTLELTEVHDKPYIRQSWYAAGLITDPVRCTRENVSGETYAPTIWRIEFSIKSGVKNWVTIERNGNPREKHSIRNTLEMYDTPEKRLAMFMALQEHYFHFRHYKYGKAKWDCPRKELFKFTPAETFYNVEHPSSTTPASTLAQRLEKYLRQYRNLYPTQNITAAADTIIEDIQARDTSRLCSSPTDLRELKALQQTISYCLQHPDIDPLKYFNKIYKSLTEGKEAW